VAGGHSLNIKQGPGPRASAHPARIRAGQLFFPRKGPRRLRLVVKRLDGEWVRVLREDGTEASVALDLLLASDEAGNGIHYRFHGWKRLPRGYRTEMLVVSLREELGRCTLALPEWDPSTKVEEILACLPEELQEEGATGSCRADLTSPSAAALDLHAFSAAPVRGLSRTSMSLHPDVLAEGQKFRRRSDGATIRLLGVDLDSGKARAWNGSRVIRLDIGRLLAAGQDGEGLNYRYLGGGISAMRRQRSRRRTGA
jgi:hypothetical protein